MMTVEQNVYVDLVERIIDPKLLDAPEGILVGSMMMALRRQWGDKPPAVFDCLDKKLTTALRTVRERAKRFEEFDSLSSGLKN
jgi:hypothetical protein